MAPISELFPAPLKGKELILIFKIQLWIGDDKNNCDIFLKLTAEQRIRGRYRMPNKTICEKLKVKPDSEQSTSFLVWIWPAQDEAIPQSQATKKAPYRPTEGHMGEDSDGCQKEGTFCQLTESMV